MKSRRHFLKTTLLFSPVLAFPKNIFGKTNKRLPNVLILGDSISIGYFPFVKEIMKEKAMVTRPFSPDSTPENCEGTTSGVENIDRWIGDTKWDVIHFNFGLHDLKNVHTETGKNSNNPKDPHQANLKQYEENMTEIVGKLKRTGAKLIFATTTPYPDTAIKPMRLPGMPEKYNVVAEKIMKENGVVINDLYTLVLPRMSEIQLPSNVHFTEPGYEVLGEAVAQKIVECLQINKN
ncbi:MAG: SGNH/GDSL hydrolase family protein [Saprospiraceae bacterium]|nr:SGNH/GDSL hydrolase family protein [Saprospiraceae bacterium]